MHAYTKCCIKFQKVQGLPEVPPQILRLKEMRKTKKCIARTHDLQFIALSGERRKLSKTEKDIFLSTTKCYSLPANDRQGKTQHTSVIQSMKGKLNRIASSGVRPLDTDPSFASHQLCVLGQVTLSLTRVGGLNVFTLI